MYKLIGIILLLIYFGLATGSSADENRIFSDDWKDLKTIHADSITAQIKESIPKNSSLLTGYLSKYPSEYIFSMQQAALELFPNYTRAEALDASHEAMAYTHLIFAYSRWHRIDENIKIVKRYEQMIRNFAKIYNIPEQIPLAVISWENSGDTSKISYAACGGLGQMSQGAVARAHIFAQNLAKKFKKEAAHKSEDEAYRLRQQAEFFNLDKKHRALAHKLGVNDERMIPECNIEDSVIYLKTLMGYFDDRPDLAISAYHNGVANNDDLIRAYLGRRGNIVQLIRENNIKFLDLWNDITIKNMMNGWLTMDGELTSYINASEALGDESDIYPWKILGAYCAFIDYGSKLSDRIVDSSHPTFEFETAPFDSYSSEDSITKAIKAGKLIKVKVNNEKHEAFMRPELYGFIKKLILEVSAATPKKNFDLPFIEFLSTNYTKNYNLPISHQRGMAITIDARYFKLRKILYSRLKYHNLHDMIYLKRDGEFYEFCINPRYGLELLEEIKKRG